MPKRVTASFVKPSMPTIRRRKVKAPDPNKHHYWARPDKVDQHMEDHNYVVVEGKDGPRRSGADILLCCRRDEYEKRERERSVMAAEKLQGPVEGFKMQGLKYGVPVIDGSSMRRGPMDVVLSEPDPRIPGQR